MGRQRPSKSRDTHRNSKGLNMAREKIGTVKQYDENKAEATVHLTKPLSKDDKVAFLGPVAYESEKVKQITQNGQKKETVEEGKVKIPTDTQVRENTTIYKIT